MYTWTMLFVTLTAIYAYRIVKEYKIKNWILFAIFSLCAAHCHYYGLVTVAIINGLLSLYILFSKKIPKKKYIITFIIIAIAQIAGYLPWIPIFLKQANAVSHGYWIPLTWGDTVVAPLGVQFNGKLSIAVTAVYTLIMYSYLIYQIICNKKQGKPITLAMFCLAVHFILYFSMLIVTVLIKPIMYYRYMLITTGVLIFPFAYYIANSERKHQKVISLIVVLIVLTLGIYNNMIIVRDIYEPANETEVEYIKGQYQDNTIILYKDIYHATNIFVQMPEYNWYLYNLFYDYENWNVEPAYKAFGKEMIYTNNIETLENYKGRIWIVNSDNYSIYEEFKEKYGDRIELIKQEIFNTEYHGYNYSICLIEKDN